MALIKILKDFLTKTPIYPQTKTSAVYDDTVGRLDTFLHNTLGAEALDDVEVEDVDLRDADTLGGKYKAEDIDTIKQDIANTNATIGETDISGIGDGTLTGGLSTLNTNLNDKQDILTRYKYDYILTASAGEKGYKSIAVSPNIKSNNVIGIDIYTRQVSATSGLQITPICHDYEVFYFQFYAPNAISSISITFTITVM